MIVLDAALVLLATLVQQPEAQILAMPDSLATPAGNQKLKDPQSLAAEHMQVEVSLGTEMIWSGQMTVNRLMGASYTFRISNAAEKGCPDPVRGASVGRDLTVELGNSYYGSYGKPNEYRVAVNYFRSRPSASCKPANRALRLEETVHLLPGQETTLTGDGGFRIRVVRQPK